MNRVRLFTVLAAAGLMAYAVLAGSTTASAADVTQPYNFTGTLTSGLAGDTSVTGSFTIDFTKQTIPTFDLTAPGTVFNSSAVPPFIFIQRASPIYRHEPRREFYQHEVYVF
jgi:hypothetical protein